MPNDLHYDMQTLGFLARSSRLHQLGHSRERVARAVRDGWLTRPVRPWLATRAAPRDAIIAVTHRGTLTDASALGARGIWRGLDRSIHVLLNPSSPGSVATSTVPLSQFAQPKHLTAGVVRHWGRDQTPAADDVDWLVSVGHALRSFGRSQAPEALVAAADSALHSGELRHSELAALFTSLPQRRARTLGDVDGRAEAGTESLARQRLRPLARELEIQVRIGKHRVDLLIDGWLVVEIDSEEFHAATRLENLQRDAWLTAQGYRVVRLDYAQVMYEWHACEAAVLDLLRFPPIRRPAASTH